MAVQPIRLFGDPVLRTTAEPVVAFDRELRSLVKEMQAILRSRPGRAGIAAPQIGVPIRVVAFNFEGRAGHLVNPTLETSGRRIQADESCLSTPGASGNGFWWPVSRPYAAIARGKDATGKSVTVRGLGMFARVLQHEVDHLDGVLFFDHLTPEDQEQALAELTQVH
ncbi:peptide deformylase [Rhizohabitans arisaemae]|uniref:peptide deformylase n=1 Tax=Rhizohabitans arisaemae TaxID=2720610 RepID=UPI0024B0F946|nr:peptide deformylase [Rhizohabitans arisaemae]